MAKRKKKLKKFRDPNKFIIIEGNKLNEKTGVMEPYYKKVYWGERC